MAQDFDSLMAKMGVKPMNQDNKQVSKPKPKPKAIRRARKTDPKAFAEPGMGERLVALEQALVVAKEERTQAEAQVTSLKKKLRAARKRVTVLEAEVQDPRPSVSETLQDWGFETAPERATLLRQGVFLERIISNPFLEKDHALMVEIGQAFSRVCTVCEPPKQTAAVHVPPEKCIVCGGRNMDVASRRFADAALLNGRLRIVIVGRSTMHHRVLRRFIGTDKRMVVTQLPGDVRRDVASAQTDVDHADAVILWDPDSVEPELLDCYSRAQNCRLVSAGPVGALLEEAAQFIGGD